MAKKKTKVEGEEAVVVESALVTEAVEQAVAPETSEPVGETEPAPTPKPRKTRKAAVETSDITLEDLAARYLAHLEDSGKSQGTSFSYKLELCTALDELGAKTKLADLTGARVLDYFISARVTRTKTGVEKAPPTVKKTRRVLRLALVWAQEAGLIERAPRTCSRVEQVKRRGRRMNQAKNDAEHARALGPLRTCAVGGGGAFHPGKQARFNAHCSPTRERVRFGPVSTPL